jgi:hypothetical protein
MKNRKREICTSGSVNNLRVSDMWLIIAEATAAKPSASK